MHFPQPHQTNGFLHDHIMLLVESHLSLTGRHLVPTSADTDEPDEIAQSIYHAPFFVASHGLQNDPVLNYGNQCAMDLFEMNWKEFTNSPSQYTAEAPNREERDRLLREVTEHGFIDNYAGVRISSTGKRFRIENATVWNVSDKSGNKVGQAATFKNWHYC